jgi:hypothetical protein
VRDGVGGGLGLRRGYDDMLFLDFGGDAVGAGSGRQWQPREVRGRLPYEGVPGEHVAGDLLPLLSSGALTGFEAVRRAVVVQWSAR